MSQTQILSPAFHQESQVSIMPSEQGKIKGLAGQNSNHALSLNNFVCEKDRISCILSVVHTCWHQPHMDTLGSIAKHSLNTKSLVV